MVLNVASALSLGFVTCRAALLSDRLPHCIRNLVVDVLNGTADGVLTLSLLGAVACRAALNPLARASRAHAFVCFLVVQGPK